jgi:hypothetical protein
MMILMGYILMGHRHWSKASIKILALYPEEELQEQHKKLISLIDAGRIPISRKNIHLMAKNQEQDAKTIINKVSQDADLTIIGFRGEMVKHLGKEVFSGYDKIGDILFMNTSNQKTIK